MARSVTLNNTSFSIPQTGDSGWSLTGGVDDYLVALASGVLTKVGGAFTLTADVDFGGSNGAIYGLKSNYFGTRTASAAVAGVLRLANADNVSWRNAANNADLALTVNSSNVLQFNGNPIVTLALGSANTALTMNSGGTAYAWTTITNAQVDVAAAIAYSKLSLTGSILNTDVNASAAIAYSKLNLTGSVVNADVSSSAAIAYSKLNLSGAVQNSDLAGGIAYSKLSLTGSIVNADIANAAAIAYSKLSLTGSVVNADISASAAIAYSKLNLSTSIVNGDISASAAIAGSKISPNFGSQNIATTGTGSWASGAITGTGGAGYLDLAEQSAAPSSPAASTLRLYSDTNDALWLKNSAGTASQVGSGAGEKNYLTSGASTSAGWSTSGTVATTTDTTSSDPRPNTTKTALKLTSGAAADYAYTRFTLDDADFNTKLKIQFAQAATVGTDWKVEIYSNTASNYSGTSTRLALSTDSSSVSALPGLTGTYRTTFDAPGSAAKWLELRFVRVANASALYVSDIVVGPGTSVQGAAVSQWQSYTPTWASTGTAVALGNGTLTGYYRRVGDTMDVNILLNTGTTTTYGTGIWTFSIPSGFTINQTSFTQGADGTQVGVATGIVTASLNVYLGSISVRSSTSVQVASTGGVADTNWQSTQPATWAASTANQEVQLSFTVPINEWAGSGTLNVVQNDIEYSWNDGSAGTAANTTYTTGMQYGPSGGTFPNVTISSTTASTNTAYKVSFQTPISSTDRIDVEVSLDSGVTWGIAGLQQAGSITTGYQGIPMGINWIHNDSTSVLVQFSNAGRSTTSTYGTAQSTWSLAANNLWRVRKIRGGQAVGFGQVTQTAAGLVASAGQLLGTNTNDSANAGNVGEIYSNNGAGAPTSAATATAAASGSIAGLASITNLPAGDWDVSVVCTLKSAGGTFTANSASAIYINTTNAASTGTVDHYTALYQQANTSVTSSGQIGALFTPPKVRFSFSSPTTVYVNGSTAYSTTAPTWATTIVARRVR